MILQPALNRLQERKSLLGYDAKKSLGQNFLINDSVILKIFKSIKLEFADELIEIGPGLGALTDGLLELNKNFTAIELDKRFAEYWKSKKINVIEGDALQIGWDQFSKPYLLVSNLPYQISSSLVVERSMDNLGLCRQMILMFQKEVAQRIRGQVGSSEYGFLSVLSQTFWTIKTVCDAGPGDFRPPPKIASRVLSFEPNELFEIRDRKSYLKFLKASFLHPRKMIVRNWQQGIGLSRQEALDLLEAECLKENSRPHEIGIDQFANLYHNWKP